MSKEYKPLFPVEKNFKYHVQKGKYKTKYRYTGRGANGNPIFEKHVTLHQEYPDLKIDGECQKKGKVISFNYTIRRNSKGGYKTVIMPLPINKEK